MTAIILILIVSYLTSNHLQAQREREDVRKEKHETRWAQASEKKSWDQN